MFYNFALYARTLFAMHLGGNIPKARCWRKSQLTGWRVWFWYKWCS